MSGGAFGGARGYSARAPEKGVFPLDHFGECKLAKEQYMECLQRNAADAAACQEAAKLYLQCRMERNLMAPQDLKELGFGDSGPKPAGAGQGDGGGSGQQQPERKEAAGFIAGLSKFDRK